MKKFWAITVAFATAAGTLFADGDGGNFLQISAPGDSSGKKIYTPARSAVRVREHLITPFYALCAQRLPSSLSDGGKLASTSWGSGFSWRYVHPEKTRISLTTADWLRTDYRFSGGRAAPFKHTDSFSATTYHELINPKTGLALVGIASATAAAEDRTALSKGVGGFAALGAKQYFSESTSVTFGLSALYRFDRERWFLYPFVSFDWSISENLNLRMLNGLSLTWDVNGDDTFLLDLSANYRTSAFAVEAERDDASPYFGEHGAYYEQRVPVSLTGTWNLTENLFVNAGVTLIAWSKYRLYRNGHDAAENFTADPTVEFVLQAGVKF